MGLEKFERQIKLANWNEKFQKKSKIVKSSSESFILDTDLRLSLKIDNIVQKSLTICRTKHTVQNRYMCSPQLALFLDLFLSSTQSSISWISP